MAKNTRKLSIVVAVRDQTKKKLGGITASLRKFGAAASKAIATAFKVGLAVATVALAVFVAKVKQQFDEIDRLAKDAFRFGIPIEQIAGLELAAKLAGLSLDQMMTIMRDMQRRVSEAADGTGEAVDALIKLKINAKELNRMGILEQFDVVRRALKDYKNLNDRNAIAFDIMGRSGAQAMTMLNSSMHSAILEVELLGSSLNNEIGGNVQDANDAVTRMHESFKGIYRTVAGLVAPTVEKVAKSIRNAAIQVRFTAEVWVPSIQLRVTRLFLSLHKGISGLTLAIERGILVPVNHVIRGLNIINRQLNRPDFLELKPLSQSFADRITEALRNTIKELEGDIERADRLKGRLGSGFGLKELKDFFRSAVGGADDDAKSSSRTPAGLPGLTGGRLITGAAQSGAEMLAAAQREADARRRKEAADAHKQRERSNELLRDLLRGAVSGNSNLGTLLQ